MAIKFTKGYFRTFPYIIYTRNGKKLMLKISTICLILQEFLQRFISMGLKWETHGFDYLLHLSLQEAMII